MWEEAMAEFRRSIKLIKSKLGLLETKTNDITKFTKDFHLQTDQLEKLYLRDIEQRKKYFLEHERISGEEEKIDVDLTEIDRMFDEIEAEEGRSSLQIVMKIPNLLMVGVIAMSGVLWTQLQTLGNKNRKD
jgi:hypothetical protein